MCEAGVSGWFEEGGQGGLPQEVPFQGEPERRGKFHVFQVKRMTSVRQG